MCKQINPYLAVFIHANLKYFNSFSTHIYFHSLIKASWCHWKVRTFLFVLTCFCFPESLSTDYTTCTKAVIKACYSRHKAGSNHAYHVLYTAPQPFCAVYMCLLNPYNQVQKMSINCPMDYQNFRNTENSANQWYYYLYMYTAMYINPLLKGIPPF